MERVGAPGGGRGFGRPGRIGRLLAIAVALAAVATVLALATALASAVTERRAATSAAIGQGSQAGSRSGSDARGGGADTQRVHAPGARRIVLDFDSARLDLEAAPAGVAEATVERRWSGPAPTLRHRFENGVLHIVSRCPHPR